MGGAKAYIALAAAGATALSSVGSAFAQQERLGGQTLYITVGQTLSYSDNINLTNPADAALQSRSSIDFAFKSITRTQSLTFDLGGAYEIDTDGNSGIDNPYARFAYAIEGANSRLSLSSQYRRVDIDDTITTFRENPDDPDLPIVETDQIERGVRTNINNELRYATGLRGPVGFSLDVTQRLRRYAETTSTSLFDSETRRANAQLDFRIDPQISARVTASRLRYVAEDSNRTNRTESSFGVGLTFAVDPTLEIDTSLRYTHIERDQLSGTSTTSGLNYAMGLTQELKNGLVSVSFSSAPTLNGRRSTLRANRAMDTRREGRLSYGIGVSKTSGLSAEPLFNISYAQPTKRGRFNLAFSQQARTDELDDEAVILTRFSAGYSMPLTSAVNWSVSGSVNDVSARSATGEDRRRVSFDTSFGGPLSDVASWSAGINFSDVETSSATSSESQRRFGVNLSYRRQMSRDWDLVTSFQHISIDDSASTDRTANTISVGLEKTFGFRP